MRKIILAFILILSLVSAEDFLGEDSHSGFVKIDKDSDIFYWLFRSRTDKTNDPLVIWLSGGPGCSSSLALFAENGPFSVNKSSLNLTKNNFSWNQNSNLVFVDQPVGTGLSYADPAHPSPYCKNMSDVANDFYYALKELYQNPNGCFNMVGITGAHPLFVFG